jgi:hypothetical protein
VRLHRRGLREVSGARYRHQRRRRQGLAQPTNLA